MVNMFSIGPMSGMYGSYGMSGMYGMGGMYAGSNVHQSYKSRYGVGYPDSGATTPYAQPYPMAIVQRANNYEKSLFKKIFPYL